MVDPPGPAQGRGGRPPSRPPGTERRTSLRTRLLLAAGALAVAGLLVEAGVRWRYRDIRLYRNWRWLVETHLVDQTWGEYRARQARLEELRRAQGMERGRSHAVFGWTYNPGFTLEDPELDLSLHVNRHGLRGEEFPADKPPGELRVICLGGSTTAGEEVDDDETYPARLQALLRARFPERAVRVINAGVPSYSLEQSLDHYALRLRRFEPDFVSVYHGINDLFEYGHEGVGIQPRLNFNGQPVAPFVYEGDAAHGSDGLLRELVRAISRRSLAWQLLRERTRPAREIARSDPDRLAEGLELYRQRYDALLAEIAASGATAVPMTFALAWPGDFTPEEEPRVRASLHIWLDPVGIALQDGPDVVERQNQAIEDLSREHDLPLARVAGAVPHDARHFVDACHLTAAGNRRIAEVLADAIEERIELRH
jgi:lysophospholipase L1-like esterase